MQNKSCFARINRICMTEIESQLEHSPRIIYTECLSSKKKALELIASSIANDSELSIGDILDAFTKRERLGSTNCGKGIAIPHGKIKHCENPMGVLLIVDQSFCEQIKTDPIDLFFGLIVPTDSCDTHVDLLKRISTLAEASEALKLLRTEKDPQKIYTWIQNTNPTLAEILI